MGDGAPTGPVRVFLSHASVDRERADAVYEAFEAAGIHCFYAPRAILVGRQYQHEIMHAINESEVMVVLLSPDSVASKHVLREATRADDREGGVILPYSIGDIKSEKDLSAEWRYLLTTIQMVPLPSPAEVVATTRRFLTGVSAPGGDGKTVQVRMPQQVGRPPQVPSSQQSGSPRGAALPRQFAQPQPSVSQPSVSQHEFMPTPPHRMPAKEPNPWGQKTTDGSANVPAPDEGKQQPPLRPDLQSALDSLGALQNFGSQGSRDTVQELLRPDENVIAVCSSGLESTGRSRLSFKVSDLGAGYLVLTSLRLLFVVETSVAKERREWPLAAISGVDWTPRRVQGTLTISAYGAQHEYELIKKSGAAFAERLRDLTPNRLPAPTAAPTVDPGWYQHPEDPTRVRWWDGNRWTDHVR